MPLAMVVGSAKYYLHYNQAGSLQLVTDSNHKIIKHIKYDSFGNITNKDTTEFNASFTTPFGFAGGLYDRDTDLIHFGYREYDSNSRTWLSKDPIGFAGGDANLYGYVLGDPVNFVDPLGLYAWLLRSLSAIASGTWVGAGIYSDVKLMCEVSNSQDVNKLIDMDIINLRDPTQNHEKSINDLLNNNGKIFYKICA